MKFFFLLLTFLFTRYGSFAQVKVVTDGKVMIGSLMIPKDQLQIGDRLTFTTGKVGVKLLNYNTYYDGATQAMKRFTTDGCSTMAFDSYGNLSFSASPPGGAAGDAIAVSNRMLIAANGNVGIGTTNPRERFQIGEKWSFGDYGNIKSINFNTYNDGTTKRFSADGCGAIAFDSWGTMSFSTVPNGGSAGSNVSLISRMFIHSDGTVEIPNTVTIGSTYYYSDKKFKTNIASLESPLEMIKKLRGVSYNFALNPKDQPSTEKHYGFIAQELQEVLPELVKADKLGQLAVNYTAVIPFLVEAVKSQQKQIAELQDLLNRNSAVAAKQLSTITIDVSAITNGCQLLQNYPNPFNSSTKIQAIVLDAIKSANLFVYDMTGAQKLSIAIKERGSVDITISATSLSPGVYYYTLICDSKEIGTKRMILTDQK